MATAVHLTQPSPVCLFAPSHLVGLQDAGGRPSVVLTGQVLLNYQRQLHTRFLDFAPAIEARQHH